MRGKLLSLLAFAFAAPAAFGQAHGALPPLTVQVDVKVVNVDVVVVDDQGRPVTNLTIDDFEVFEDNKPQKITNFYLIEKGAVQDPSARRPPAAAGAAPDRFRRKIVLLVDNNYIEKVERDRALVKIEEFVDKTFDGNYEWAIAAVGQNLDVVQSFTSERGEIHAAIAKVRSTPAFSYRREIDRTVLSDRTRRQEFASEYDYAETVRFLAREQTYRTLRAVTSTARAVSEMARAYSATEGKKVIVLLTGGIETNTSFTAYESKSDREVQQTKLLIAKTIDEMVREANAGNFTIHVLNARTRGMIAPQHDVVNRSSGINLQTPNLLRSSAGSGPIDTTDVDSSSLSVALGTGGAYLTSNVIEQSLERLDRLTSNYYSLGYSPRSEDDRQYHRIAVRVKRRGVQVSHRQGYVDLSPEDRLQEFLRARVSFMKPTGSLPVTIELGQSTPKEKGVSVPVWSALPMEKVTMIPVDGQYVGRVHVYLSVFDSAGSNVAFYHQMQEVTLSPREFEQAGRQAFRYKMNVRLEKGEYTVVITLRDDLSNEIGSAIEAVRI